MRSSQLFALLLALFAAFALARPHSAHSVQARSPGPGGVVAGEAEAHGDTPVSPHLANPEQAGRSGRIDETSESDDNSDESSSAIVNFLKKPSYKTLRPALRAIKALEKLYYGALAKFVFIPHTTPSKALDNVRAKAIRTLESKVRSATSIYDNKAEELNKQWHLEEDGDKSAKLKKEIEKLHKKHQGRLEKLEARQKAMTEAYDMLKEIMQGISFSKTKTELLSRGIDEKDVEKALREQTRGLSVSTGVDEVATERAISYMENVLSKKYDPQNQKTRKRFHQFTRIQNMIKGEASKYREILEEQKKNHPPRMQADEVLVSNTDTVRYYGSTQHGDPDHPDHQTAPSKRSLSSRDTVATISASRSQAGSSSSSSSSSQNKAAFASYLAAYELTQSNISTVILPIIRDWLNGTSDPVVLSAAHSVYAELTWTSPVLVNGPFSRGGHCLDQIETDMFNSTNTAALNTTSPDFLRYRSLTLASHQALIVEYNELWTDASRAANSLGYYDNLKTLGGYLLPEDQSIMPAGWADRTEKTYDASIFEPPAAAAAAAAATTTGAA